jgi:cell division protein FtsB
MATTGTTTRRPAGTTTAATRPPRQAPRRPAPPRARAPFVLLIVGLLGGALVSLLLLNTVLAQDAFTLSELQRDNRQLAERKEALQADIARESDPEVLHQKARSLGMVDSQGPAFIDPRTGKVTEGGVRPQGVSDEAVAAAAAGAVTGAPGALVPPAGGTTPRQNTAAPGQKATTGRGSTAPHAKTAAPRQGGGTR